MDNTIKVAVIGVEPEDFNAVVLAIKPPQQSFFQRIFKGKPLPEEVPILLVDSIDSIPSKQIVIAKTTLPLIKDVVAKNESNQLLLECAEEYLKIVKPKILETTPYPAPAVIEYEASVKSEAKSKHHNKKGNDYYKKKRKRKEASKQRKRNQKK